MKKAINTFKGPFLNVSDEALNTWDMDREKHSSIVPWHGFYIVSEGERTKKKILWTALTGGERDTLKTIGWEKMYIWTEGTMELLTHPDDSNLMNLNISYGPGGSSPHLLTIRPFIKKIANYLDKKIDRLEIDTFLKITLDSIVSSGFSYRITEEPVILTR